MPKRSDRAAGALTDKERAFCAEYIIDFNATAAAKRAGYCDSTSRIATLKMLPRPHVQAYLKSLIDARSKRTEITADRVLLELARIGFANIGDYIRVTRDGDPCIDLTKAANDPAKMAAIAEASSEDYVEGRGEDARTVRKSKIKLYDKIAALQLMGRHLGIFNDKMTVKYDLSNLSDEELEQLEKIQSKIGTT